MKKVNYLNNKDLLEQIHLSKATYSSYLSPEDSRYDIIVDSVDEINSDTVAQAKANKAKRLSAIAWEQAKAEKRRNTKMADVAVDPDTVETLDLVFRVMTFDHVPDEPGRKKNPKSVADTKEKVNFPPYQHYRYNTDMELECVGKSHWKGGMINGHFCTDHGSITPKLAHMYMKLCDRYGTRSNWRGYTYNDEMRAQALVQLSQIGLQFDESKSENPFAYYTAAITNSFTRILNLEKKNQTIRDDLLEEANLNPSYTRQSANEESAKQSAKEKLKRLFPGAKHYTDHSEVKTYSAEELAELNKRLHDNGELTEKDYKEVSK